MNLNGWKNTPVWSHDCIGNLVSAEFAEEDGLNNPRISEEGRRFLANLLNQLSDTQIRELFQVARVGITGETIEDHGHKRPVNIDDWVAAFKFKRNQINDRRCE